MTDTPDKDQDIEAVRRYIESGTALNPMQIMTIGGANAFREVSAFINVGWEILSITVEVCPVYKGKKVEVQTYFFYHLTPRANKGDMK